MKSYIKFIHTESKAATLVWAVVNGSEPTLSLGTVRWHGPWRRYIFEAVPGCIFDHGCLREIADFCELKTLPQHRMVPKTEGYFEEMTK